MKMLLNVYDKGTAYFVNSAYIVQQETPNLNPDVKVIEITDTQVFAIITEELLQNNIVKLPVGVSPITPADIIVDIIDDLVAAKYAATIKVKNFIAKRSGMPTFYDLFEFNLASNTLYAEGIFITDSNREEKYIEVIETNRVELIEALETYLNARDIISQYYSLHAQAKTAISLIDNANDIPSVENYLANFLAGFN